MSHKFVYLSAYEMFHMFISGELVNDVKQLVSKDEPIVIVIGAMAHGSVSFFSSKQHLNL